MPRRIRSLTLRSTSEFVRHTHTHTHTQIHSCDWSTGRCLSIVHASLLPHPAHTDWTPGRPARGRNWSHAAAAAPVITPDTGRRRRRRRGPSVRPSVRRPINRYAAVRSGRLGLAASPPAACRCGRPLPMLTVRCEPTLYRGDSRAFLKSFCPVLGLPGTRKPGT